MICVIGKLKQGQANQRRCIQLKFAGLFFAVPKVLEPTPLLRRATFCVRRGELWLIEQRPAKGRWAGMWQFLTVEAPTGGAASMKSLAKRLPVRSSRLRKLGTVTHGLTHRRYEFDVYACEHEGAATPENIGPPPRRWSTLDGLAEYPLPRPHLKVAEMLRLLSE